MPQIDVLWLDDDLVDRQAITAPIFVPPFASLGITARYVLTQKFWQLQTSRVPLAPDTPHAQFPAYLFCSESPERDVGGGVVEWEETYAQVPASFSRNGGTFSYTFPVILTGLDATSRKAPFTFTVASRVQYDFFHQADPTTILIIEPQRYVLSTSPNTDATSPEGSPVVTADNIGSVIPTIPDQPTYSSWVANGIEIVPQASKVTPNWHGNIHMRETIYIKAH